MTVSRIRAALPADVRRVWEVVTDAAGYPGWRSGLRRVEVTDEREFFEYDANGFVTKFTIMAGEPYRRWELAMENDNMTGRWVGTFRQAGAGTAITFTEYVTPKKAWMRPFVKLYLKRQQAQFLANLKSALMR